MVNRQKPMKRTPAPAPQQNKPQQGRLRKTFTVIICVVVALGLMMPIAGIGVASCAGPDTGNTGSNGSLPDSSGSPGNTGGSGDGSSALP